MRYTQTPDEKVSYGFAVSPGTIDLGVATPVVWSISPAGPTVTQVEATTAGASATVEGIAEGREYVLRAVATLSGGQRRESQAIIQGVWRLLW